MLLDYFGFLVGFLEKGTKSANLEIFEVLRRGVGIPRSSVGPHRGTAERRLRQASGTLRCSKATPQQRPRPWRSTVHRHVFLLCFAIPLFRGLVYWTNEDPISV